MHSKLYLILYSVLLPLVATGQCIVDAGEDITICFPESLDTFQLDGQIVDGEPTEFKWTFIEFDEYNNRSDLYISDSTSLNPMVSEQSWKMQTFYLTATGQDGTTCTDSVNVNFSRWGWLLFDFAHHKDLADTVQLRLSVVGEWPIKSCAWSPNYMISDTTAKTPRVWNDKTVFYEAVVTDSLGCSIEDEIYEVYVNTTSSINDARLPEIELFPNPTNGSITVLSGQGVRSINLYTLDGQQIRKTYSTDLDLSDLPAAHYLVAIKFNSGQIVIKRLQKR